MNPNDINQLLAIRSETENLEFKLAQTSFEFEKLVEYCVAISNEGGGKIIFGVTDTHPRQVRGTKAFDIPEKTVQGIFDRIHIRVRFHEVNHPDGRVLVFDIPGRLKGDPIHYKGRYLMRVGESLEPMSPEELKRIFDETKPRWEDRIAKTDCTQATIIELLYTEKYFDLLKIPYPSNRAGVISRFEFEKFIINTDTGWDITNLGAILFAKDLVDFDLLARKAPRFIVYSGSGKSETRLDVQGRKGYAIAFQDLIAFVMAQVPSNEVIEDAIRSQVRMFPEIAIRELIANALIHQDFDESGGSVMIELYNNRIEISNPGKPFIDPDRFIDGYKSRNELLADIMRRLGICEEKGSGIDKVVDAAEFFQLPAPEFRIGVNRTNAILYSHRSFKFMDGPDKIRAAYQHSVLQYLTNQKMTNESLRNRFKLSERQSEIASRIIRETIEHEKIKLADPAQTSYRYRNYVPYWA